MTEKHPSRKKDKYNPYTLTITEGHYYLSFKDGRGKLQKVEINEVLYRAFDSFELEDISHLNRVSRHIEHSELTEATLNDRAFISQSNLKILFQMALNTSSYIGRFQNPQKCSGVG